MGSAISVEILLECSECGAILQAEIDDTLEANMLHCSVTPCVNCTAKHGQEVAEDSNE